MADCPSSGLHPALSIFACCSLDLPCTFLVLSDMLIHCLFFFCAFI